MNLLESLKPDIILYFITYSILPYFNFAYAAWLRLDNKKVQRHNMLFNLLLAGSNEKTYYLCKQNIKNYSISWA
ncbi:MAG: hypothetical protein PHAS_00330 [Phascolarctobacterium sp.]